MVFEEVEVVVSLVLSVASFLAWIYTVGVKMGALNAKVSLLWEVYVKDALSEATRVRGNPKVEEFFSDSLKETIRKVGGNLKSQRGHGELLVLIEKKVGTELMRVATEKKVSYRMVLGFALLVAEGSLK